MASKVLRMEWQKKNIENAMASKILRMEWRRLSWKASCH